MRTETNQEGRERSIEELFSDLTRETATLVRQEVALAKVEMREKLSQMGKYVGMLVAGGLILYAGLLALVATLIAAFAEAGMVLWGAALLAAVIVLIIGGVLAWAGINGLKRADLVPRKTLETLKEDKQWAQEQTRQAT